MNAAAIGTITSSLVLELADEIGAELSPQAILDDGFIDFGGLDDPVVVEPLIGIYGEDIDHVSIGGYMRMPDNGAVGEVVNRYGRTLGRGLGSMIEGQLYPTVPLIDEQLDAQKKLLTRGVSACGDCGELPSSRATFGSMTLGELLAAITGRATVLVPDIIDLANWFSVKAPLAKGCSKHGSREFMFASAALFASLGSPRSPYRATRNSAEFNEWSALLGLAEMLFTQLAVESALESCSCDDWVSAEGPLMYEAAAQIRDLKAPGGVEPGNPMRLLAARAWAECLEKGKEKEKDFASRIFMELRAMQNAWLSSDYDTLLAVNLIYSRDTSMLRSNEENARDELRHSYVALVEHELLKHEKERLDGRPPSSRPPTGLVLAWLRRAALVYPQVGQFIKRHEVLFA